MTGHISRLCEMLLNAVSCYDVELLAPRTTIKVENTPCLVSDTAYSVY